MSNYTTSLTSLDIRVYGMDNSSSTGPAIERFVTALRTCTLLEHLELSVHRHGDKRCLSVQRVAEAAGQLTALRSLRLDDTVAMDTKADATAFGGLTQLTSLRLTLTKTRRLLRSMAAVALRPLSNLVELELAAADLQPLAAQLPAQLTSLTFTGRIGHRIRPLPATLQRLHLQHADETDLDVGLSPDELLDLGLPIGLTCLTLSALACTRGSLGDLVEAAGLVSRLYDKHESLHLAHHWGMREEPGWHGQLFQALQRPPGGGLTRLEVSYCNLEIEDVAALVKHLPDLEVRRALLACCWCYCLACLLLVLLLSLLAVGVTALLACCWCYCFTCLLLLLLHVA